MHALYDEPCITITLKVSCAELDAIISDLNPGDGFPLEHSSKEFLCVLLEARKILGAVTSNGD